MFCLSVMRLADVDAIDAKINGVIDNSGWYRSETKVVASAYGGSENAHRWVHRTSDVQLRHLPRNHRASQWIDYLIRN